MLALTTKVAAAATCLVLPLIGSGTAWAAPPAAPGNQGTERSSSAPSSAGERGASASSSKGSSTSAEKREDSSTPSQASGKRSDDTDDPDHEDPAAGPEAEDRGANEDGGAYDPDGVGEGDNQGNGKAPANGTVGEADGKNPPGQDPFGAGGDDPNRGYECDDNKGVGDNGGNPAHSGCDTTVVDDDDKDDGKDDEKDDDGQDGGDGGEVVEDVDDTDQETTTPRGPTAPEADVVLGVVLDRPTPTVADRVLTPRATLPTQVSAATPTSLPFTGSSTQLLVLAGAVAATAGAGLVVAGRQRRTT